MTNSTWFTSTPVFFLVNSSWSYFEKQCSENSPCAALPQNQAIPPIRVPVLPMPSSSIPKSVTAKNLSSGLPAFYYPHVFSLGYVLSIILSFSPLAWAWGLPPSWGLVQQVNNAVKAG